MRSYYAKQGEVVNSGGWLFILAWARNAVQKNSAPVQILSGRGGEKLAKIIAEVSHDGERFICNGRTIKIKDLHG